MTVAAASKAALRTDKTPKRSPGSRTRRVSFALAGAPAAVVSHAGPPNCAPPDPRCGRLPGSRSLCSAAELSPFDSRPQLAGGAARQEAEQQQSGTAAPTAAASASDGSHANTSPEAQAFLAAARARLEGLTRGSGGRRRSGDRTFELALPQAAPVAAQPAPRGASLSQWAQHAETTPETANALASAARRHGAGPPLPRLPLNQTPGSHAPLALTPPPLSPTPTPNSVVTPGGPNSQGRQAHGRRSSRRIAAAAVEAETQTTPGIVAHDVAVGMTPPAAVAWEAAAEDDGGAPAAWGGYDDDDGGYGGNADVPVPTPASLVKRPRRPAGTPNKRLRAAFANRKSLAAAGLAVQDGTGARRSTRDRMRPLEYWRNETKAYGRTHRSLPTVAAVTMRSPEPGWPAPEGRWVGQKLADAGAGPAAPPKGKKAGKKAPAKAAKSRARILSDSEEGDSSDSE